MRTQEFMGSIIRKLAGLDNRGLTSRSSNIRFDTRLFRFQSTVNDKEKHGS